MKRNIFLLSALAALMFASCSKDKGSVDVPGVDAVAEPALLTLSIGEETKALQNANEGASPDELDQKISNYTVYIFDGYGNPITAEDGEGGTITYPIHVDVTTADDLTKTLKVTTAAQSIYFIANVGDPKAPNSFLNTRQDGIGAIETKADLLAKKVDYAKQRRFFRAGEFETAEIADRKLLMTGKNTAFEFDKTEAVPEANVSIGLSFPMTKLNVTVTDERFNNSGDEMQSNNRVAILYAGKDFLLFTDAVSGTPFAQDYHTSFYTGYRTAGSADIEAIVPNNPNFLIMPGHAMSTNTAVGDRAVVANYHFYVPSNTVKVGVPTILTLIADVAGAAGAAPTTAFFPVRFSAVAGAVDSKDKGPLMLGKSYNVNIKLTGEIATGGGGGTPTPEPDSPVAGMSVSVTSAEWGQGGDVESVF